MEFTLTTFLWLGSACFTAAFIDSIAGGGGLISLPAYMAAGIPPHIALGTNKVAASFSSFSSSLKFWKAGKVNLALMKYLVPFSFIGAIIGVKTVVLIDSKHLYPIALGLLIFTIIYTLYNKNMGNSDDFAGLDNMNIKKGIAMALGLGFYDGFFGPGTGSFLIFLLIRIFKYDFINASGNSKILNLSSNLASVITFILLGKVNYLYALSMAVFMFAGAQFGSQFAILKGSKFIKPIFITVSTIVAIKMASQFIDLTSIGNFIWN
ncbi:MAG: sulfite exporter TauE/SafE family protein [Fusobacteriaceae bacterium]